METENIPDRSETISVQWTLKRSKKRSDMIGTIVLISSFNQGF